MIIEIPPKYPVSQVIGFMKGESAIKIGHTYLGQRKNFTEMHCRARGFFVTTVGADEETSTCIHPEERDIGQAPGIIVAIEQRVTTLRWSEK